MYFTLFVILVSLIAWRYMPEHWNKIKRAYSLMLGWIIVYAIFTVWIVLALVGV